MPPATRSHAHNKEAPPPPRKGPSKRSGGGKPITPTKKGRKRKATDAVSDPEVEPDKDATDRSCISQPVSKYIHPTMSGAWAIPKKFQMCIIFDAVNPLRQFKRDTVFNAKDKDPFPNYNPRKTAEVTESDYEGKLQPFKPWNYVSKYRFESEVKMDSFMNWKDGQLHDIYYGKSTKRPGGERRKWNMVTKRVPVQYARLIHQFILEIELAKHTKAHEVLRRQTYAQRVLDEFGLELDRFQGVEQDFRSKVLTPILQCQLHGIPDAHGPAIRRGIDPKNGTPTIAQVTKFYLGLDPLSTCTIPSYRHNLVYIREARWHLAIVMDEADPTSFADYKITLSHHDTIMKTLKQSKKPVHGGFPTFNDVEVATVVEEGLELWFDKELKRVPALYKEALEARRVDKQASGIVPVYNNAYVMTVQAGLSGHSDDEEDVSSDNDDRPIAGPSKLRQKPSPNASRSECSSVDDDEADNDDRPLSGPPSGVPSTAEDDVDDGENFDDEAAHIDAELLASVGNNTTEGGDGNQ